MQHESTIVYSSATIIGDYGGTLDDPIDPSIGLNLFLDSDERYRWYQADGVDTEISGVDVADAIDAAWNAWNTWGIEFQQ